MPERSERCGRSSCRDGAYLDDVAIPGFDDIHGGSLLRPAADTVNNPLDEMGITAARLLMGAAKGDLLPQVPVLLPTRLVLRRSTDATATEPEDDLVHWPSGAGSWTGP
jgi:hypothetical protein